MPPIPATSEVSEIPAITATATIPLAFYTIRFPFVLQRPRDSGILIRASHSCQPF